MTKKDKALIEELRKQLAISDGLAETIEEYKLCDWQQEVRLNRISRLSRSYMTKRRSQRIKDKIAARAVAERKKRQKEASDDNTTP